MTQPSPSLPVVRPLPEDFCPREAFARVAGLPGCLWLDSASRGPLDADGHPIGRFSFLTANPIKTLVAFEGDDDPWPVLDSWYRDLPSECDPRLPPFQGGIAGLIGYEAATWLESVGSPRVNDLPTPALCLGLYDWTIAVDHERNLAWILSQGLAATDTRERLRIANERADEIERLLREPPPTSTDVSHRSPTATDVSIDSRAQHPTSHPEVNSNFSSEQFRKCVAEIVRLIHEGDSFQVNLAQRLLTKTHLAPPELYLRLRERNPAPFGAFYGAGDFSVMSSSPEGFLQVRDRVVETRPIKGTAPRTGDDAMDERLANELANSDKDHA
ncbi:MAG: chorismate-binding protein, partial [Rubripirellula sp.]